MATVSKEMVQEHRKKREEPTQYEFEMAAYFDGVKLDKLKLPVIVMDEDFFEYLEDETDYDGGSIDIGLFGLYYEEWERKHVAR